MKECMSVPPREESARLDTLERIWRAAAAIDGVLSARAEYGHENRIRLTLRISPTMMIGDRDLMLARAARLEDRMPPGSRLVVYADAEYDGQSWLSRHWIVVVLMLLAVLFVAGRAANAEPGDRTRLPCGSIPATVVRVIDGDTLDVAAVGVALRVRILGLDAPELRDRRPWVRGLALSAKARMGALVGAAKEVQLLPARGYRCMFTEHHVRWKPRVLARVMVRVGDDWTEAAPILVRERLACPRRVKSGCDPRAQR